MCVETTVYGIEEPREEDAIRERGQVCPVPQKGQVRKGEQWWKQTPLVVLNDPQTSRT